jgi:hypothetical protein
MYREGTRGKLKITKRCYFGGGGVLVDGSACMEVYLLGFMTVKEPQAFTGI